MVNKCAAFGCKSGYDTNESKTKPNNETKITFHAFPIHNKDLCEKWIRANPRQNFVPLKYSKLCSLHFKSSDFIDECQDTNCRRQKRRQDKKLLRRYLRA